jgi:hypothetical protein
MEIWKPIKDFPKYEVSNLGRVKSYMKEKPAILAGGFDKDGYHIILLYNEKGRFTKRVHRLVAEAFIPNPEVKAQVNHLNGKKADNKVDNLEWATTSENVKHAFDTGLKTSQFQEGKRPVKQINLKTNELIRVYESAKATIKDGFHRQSVGRVCRGERPHHKGYGWQYF